MPGRDHADDDIGDDDVDEAVDIDALWQWQTFKKNVILGAVFILQYFR